MIALLAGAIALVLGLALTPVARVVALRLGAIAAPGGRHVHQEAVPSAGGLAIFFGFWIAVLLTTWPLDRSHLGLLLGSTLLLIICLWDDMRRLHPAPRFLGQLVVATLAWEFGTRVMFLTNPLYHFLGGSHYLALGWLSAPLTVAWIVFVINAINWLDGLDGLAAGVSAIAAATLAIMAAHANVPMIAVMAAAVCGACLGFLRYNFAPARIFMGDTGAMFLGFILACMSVTGAFKIPTALALVVPLLVLGVPIYDVVSTVSRRVKAGRPIYNADQTHLHHRLLNRGLTQTQAVLVIYGVTALLCLAALGLWFH